MSLQTELCMPFTCAKYRAVNKLIGTLPKHLAYCPMQRTDFQKGSRCHYQYPSYGIFILGTFSCLLLDHWFYWPSSLTLVCFNPSWTLLLQSPSSILEITDSRQILTWTLGVLFSILELELCFTAHLGDGIRDLGQKSMLNLGDRESGLVDEGRQFRTFQT